ncbi:MAG: penicillin-binding protein 2 [Polyangiaceae bacterium]
MTILVQRSDVGEFRRRYSWMVLAVLLTFALLIGRLVQLQLVEHDLHHAQALRNIIRERTLATSRGVIRDSQGHVLAGNRPSYNVYVVPSIIDMEKTWPRVIELMGLEEGEEKELRERILSLGNGPRRDQQTLLKVDVDRDAVAALETHERDLNGVEVAPVPVRYYPYGELAAHILGYMREVDPDILARLDGRGYRAGDRLGAVGVERRWESYLIGQRGWKKVLGGRRAKQNREDLEDQYLDEPRRLDPVPGRDISLTLDIELMQSVERAMRGQVAGAVTVVDVRTGRILAALSKPSYDPNVVSGSNGKKAVRDAFRKLYSDPLKPTLDKTVSAAYPPGSTFKPFAALAGLADHIITPRSVVDCRGGYEYGRRYFRCTGVHRNVRLHEAIVRSCNTYFYALGEGIHIDRLSAMGMDFGFGVKTGIGINPEARGRMPTRAWYTRRYRGAFRGGFTLLSAIGQGASTVSVLQLSLGYAALANGGTLYQPQVVRSIETSDGTIVQEFPPRVRRLVEVDPENLSLVKSGLVGVVAEREGTAHKAAIPGVDMAGKTGTAQVSRRTPKDVDPHKVWYFNRDHAWFAGYAPSHSPEIAIVVLVEHGGAGGKAAVPVAMQVVRDWQKLREKRLSERSTAKRDRGVP